MSLFNNKNGAATADVGHNANNMIGKGTVITGDIETPGNLRFEGKLIGNIRAKAKVILGDSAKVDGNVSAQNAEIEGKVDGTIEIADVLVLKPSARINGDIYTGKLIVESGAVFNGSCHMGEDRNKLKIAPKLNANAKEKAKLSA